jgi:FAT domain
MASLSQRITLHLHRVFLLSMTIIFLTGFFQHAKFVDATLQCRIGALQRSNSDLIVSADEDHARSKTVYTDEICQKYMIRAVKNYVEALALSSKHVYQSLPRLLSLWFELNSINGREYEIANDVLRDKSSCMNGK